MPTPHANGGALLRSVGLEPDGPAILGRPMRANAPGVYLVELPAPLPRAPIDASVVGKWIEHLPGLTLDGAVPTTKALVARLAAFWIPSATILYVGSSETSIAGRIAAMEKHVLGDRRPHSASQWLKTLRTEDLRVWWARTDAPEEYEDAILSAFVAAVPPDERAALFDSSVVLPFANLRTPTGERRQTGIAGAVPPEEVVVPPPPTHVVELPPAAADGVAEDRNSGTIRRTNLAPPPAPTAARSARSAASVVAARTNGAASTPTRATPARATPVRATTSPRTGTRAAAQQRPPTAPLHLTTDGHARVLAELQELTTIKRPEVIDRIRKARELGDLKENADYTAAREEQSFLEGRIQAIEAQLRHAVVVETPTETHRVSLGSRVTADVLGEEVVFEIVGITESNPGEGRISTASPVGKALLGRSLGDEAIVHTPRGEVRYRITAID